MAAEATASLECTTDRTRRDRPDLGMLSAPPWRVMSPTDRPVPSRHGAGYRPSRGPRQSLTGLFGWIGDHVRGFHAALGLFLTLGLVVVALALLLFVGTAALVAEGATQRFDQSILLWLDARSTPWLDTAAVQLTALGSIYVTVPVAIIASILFWETRHRYSAGLLWISLGGGWLLSSLLKAVFARPRPDIFEWRVAYAGDSSYPSGHSLSAMVLYATLAYLTVRLESTRLAKGLTVATFAAVILVVGVSRAYLGVHYPSDVIGGFLVGFAWATICALGIEAIRYFRTRAPAVAIHEKDLDRGVLPETPPR